MSLLSFSKSQPVRSRISPESALALVLSQLNKMIDQTRYGTEELCFSGHVHICTWWPCPEHQPPFPKLPKWLQCRLRPRLHLHLDHNWKIIPLYATDATSCCEVLLKSLRKSNTLDRAIVRGVNSAPKMDILYVDSGPCEFDGVSS